MGVEIELCLIWGPDCDVELGDRTEMNAPYSKMLFWEINLRHLSRSKGTRNEYIRFGIKEPKWSQFNWLMDLELLVDYLHCGIFEEKSLLTVDTNAEKRHKKQEIKLS